jgi:hypothetical protein
MCTIIDFPGQCMQIPAYNDCLKNFGDTTKWLIVADGDEYILPKKHFSIRDFLNDYDDFHAIGINWVMFGTSFHDNKQTGYLIDKYRYCSRDQNPHIKTICKPEMTKEIIIHGVLLYDSSKYVDAKKNIISEPFNHNYTIDIIQINHYSGKSIEEWYEKYYRGNADSDLRITIPDNLHTQNNDM